MYKPSHTQVAFEQHGFELVGPFISRFFSINTVNVFSLPYNFLNNIFFSVAYFIVRIQCM